MQKLHHFFVGVLVTLFSSALFAADSTPKDEVVKASKALGEAANYSWKTVVTVPPDAQFRPGPSEGKAEKNGPVSLTMSFNGNTTEAIVKGNAVAIKREDSGWQSAAELENEEGPARFMAARLKNFKAPAEQAQEILNGVKELKKEGDVISGDLTEEGAKTLIRFRRGGDGPQVSNAKGSVKFWIKDGALAKFEYKVKGSMSFNGNDMDVDRTTTTEIKDVGSTKVTIPEAAQKKLS